MRSRESRDASVGGRSRHRQSAPTLKKPRRRTTKLRRAHDPSCRAKTACASPPPPPIPLPTGAMQEIIPTSATKTSSGHEDRRARQSDFRLARPRRRRRSRDRHSSHERARYFVPHMLALSTNSPFWLGMDMGLKSYRCKVFDKFPRTNLPDYFPELGRVSRNSSNLLVKTNCIDNAKKIWWDIRPASHSSTRWNSASATSPCVWRRPSRSPR